MKATWDDLAGSLGLTLEKLAWLAWCKVPRDANRDNDIRVIAERVGINAETLRELLGADLCAECSAGNHGACTGIESGPTSWQNSLCRCPCLCDASET